MSGFAIGVHRPSVQNRSSPRRYTPELGEIYEPITIDPNAFVKPVSSLLKTHKDAPMSFKIAVSATGHSIKLRQEYLLNLKKNVRYNYTPLYKVVKDLHMQTYTQIQYWFKKEISLKAKLKPLYYAWLVKKYKARMLNTEDPFTLSVPENPVYMFDANSRGTYVFDGKSIKKHIETCLGYNRWMIPEPREPTSPLTNLVLTLGQLISIRSQLCKHGLSSWMIEGFAKTKYNLATFETEFKLPLRLHSLDDLYRNPTSEDAIDEVREFINKYTTILEPSVTEGGLASLNWAITNMPQDPYIIEWRVVWKDYFKKYLVDPTFTRSNTGALIAIESRITRLFHSKELDRIHKEKNKNSIPHPRIDVWNTESLAALISVLNVRYHESDINGNDTEETEDSSGGSL